MYRSIVYNYNENKENSIYCRKYGYLLNLRGYNRIITTSILKEIWQQISCMILLVCLIDRY